MNETNFYQQSSQHIEEPPQTFGKKLRFLGPGFILSASIVGSGELIATTTLGAEAGFIALWIILISCLVKVMLQLEFGKYTLLFQQTAMQAFNAFPGKKWGKAHPLIWTFFAMMVIKLLQLGGIVGGVALALNIAIPQIPIWVWACLAAIGCSLLIQGGKYQIVEKMSIGMIGLFTIFTFVSLYFLRFTPYAFDWKDIQVGLSFQLPVEIIGVAIAAFGITGVGGDEIIHYTYWCTEKGYAAKCGPNDGSTAWQSRAKGWIRVMQLDAVFAMLVYTLMTCAFFLLGAAVLHARGEVPEGYAMLETLSNMYTESLGSSARWAFMAGAGIVLFSTMFAALAAWTRQYSDIFSQIGWMDFTDAQQRRTVIRWLAWGLPVTWVLLFLFIQLPVAMVLIGGTVTSLILLIVVYASVRFHRQMEQGPFRTTFWYKALFWLSVGCIIAIAIYGIWKLM